MRFFGHEPFGWWFRVVALAAILIVCILGWAKLRFGSLTTARAYFRGQVVEVSFASPAKNRADGTLHSAREVTVEFKKQWP